MVKLSVLESGLGFLLMRAMMTKLLEVIIEAMLFIWLIVVMFKVLFPDAVPILREFCRLMTGW
jgi:uncharacterized membrane-anchored protein